MPTRNGIGESIDVCINIYLTYPFLYIRLYSNGYICSFVPFPLFLQNDGMHLCPETFHGRINAALVCLLDCKFSNKHRRRSQATCSNGCNSKYMNLQPIEFRLNKDLKEEISLTSWESPTRADGATVSTYYDVPSSALLPLTKKQLDSIEKAAPWLKGKEVS